MRIALFVIAATVGAAAVVPSQASTTPPLAGLKLVAEKSAPHSEISAAQKNGKNGNQNGNKGFYGGFYGGFGGPRGGYGYFAPTFSDDQASPTGSGNGELGDLDLKGDSDLGLMNAR